MMKDDRDHLVDMAEALERIEKYIAQGKSAFDEDELVQNWVISHLRILSESSSDLSPGYRSSHPKIPWLQLCAMQHTLTDHYFDLDKDQVWSTVMKCLPHLHQHMEQYRREYDGDSR